ncbi:acyl-CoA dehydrogenase family protein [Sphingobium subterraneum]|uniref:(2S)-methylsuccinyl-CoA dehydrogenase n=1 Tax=Sphingobium subterraneum TaxID=627688 RepID=A0A841J547_9SPHN|nr:acyl-CoA dehydrogenase family protein [Sphingobium subterraneum]MBB6123351.1 (2S)-methylsuccinyl-CoA dehydrogenase [Sphingobium subterraneum]
MTRSPVRSDQSCTLRGTIAAAVVSLDEILGAARRFARNSVSPREETDTQQHALHGLAWLATYIETVKAMADYIDALDREDRFGALERLLVQVGVGETLDQIFGGIAMSQGETIRLRELGIDAADAARLRAGAVNDLIEGGNTASNRAQLAEWLVKGGATSTFGDDGLDETLAAIRDQMQSFVAAKVTPHAQSWHLRNDYIPLSLIAEMSEMGVFGLTIPEAFGGLGLSKVSMCVVSEELSRGYIGVGSLGTRSEIAAELIISGGTDAQKAHFLPRISAGEIIPTAVFTEPDNGSDLAALRTRAVREGEAYVVTGNKTWITHGARANVMTILARTGSPDSGHRGLSILLAEKPPATEQNDFPVEGLTGGEIEVLGYRGMKEYELAFDGFQVPAEGLLGGVEGQGFRQLMQTFESARIQTAARAIGVAQSALDLGLSYALDRKQFGKPLIAFPRVADKLVAMAVEIHLVRQLTYRAARAKDEGRRCDLEAGMAKLLAARTAWAAADNAVQIHGGNGFALEFPISRVLCDARILSIFEGAAEIQAQVISRRLLESE